MAMCAMCRKTIDAAGDHIMGDRPVCAACAKNLSDIIDSGDRQTVRDAFNYVYKCQQQATDPGVVAYLKEYLENNESVLEDLGGAEQQQPEGSVSFNRQTDYFSDRKREVFGRSIPPISLLLGIIAVIVWLGGTIMAADISKDMGSDSFWLVFFVALVLGSLLMATASIVMYLSRIAEDAEEIKGRLKK